MNDQRTDDSQIDRETPTIETARLLLRPFRMSDARVVQRLAGDPVIAATTMRIPHPYELEMVEEWIEKQEREGTDGVDLVFAVTRREDGALVGAAGLNRDPAHEHAELGYWIGKPYWRQGYACEAARAIVSHGFARLGYRRIFARCFVGNPASRRVLEKLGMAYEGCQRRHVKKNDGFRDVELFGLLREDWQS